MKDIGLFVSYQESLTNFNFAARLLPEFQKRIPLRHCQWRNVQNAKPSFKPIDQLNFELIHYDEYSRLRSQLKESKSSTILFSKSSPILHLLFIMVDDIEIYKSATKNNIKSWVAALPSSTDWLIIHVTNQEATKTGLKSYLSGSVFDKLKSEFKEKCCQIRLNDLSDVEMWHEVMRKISDSILMSFASFLANMESAVKAIEENYKSPSSPTTPSTIVITPTNFGEIFIAKENIALGFMLMNMLDEAYACYEELHVIYHSILNEARKLGGSAPDISILKISSLYQSDGRSLNTSLAKSYPEKLEFRTKLAADASVIDCELHIISCKSHILLTLKRFEFFLIEAMDFIQFMSIVIMNDKGVLSKDCNLWLYSLSIQFYEYISAKLESEQMEDESKRRLNNRLGELLFVSRRLLDLLGNDLNLWRLPLSNRYQTLSSITVFPGTESLVVEADDQTIRLGDILQCVETPKHLVALYLKLSNLLIKKLEPGGNYRLTWLIMNDVATLQLLFGKCTEAIETFIALHQVYKDRGWKLLASHISKKLSFALEKAGKANDFVLVCLRILADGQMLSPQEGTEYVSKLLHWANLLESEIKFNINRGSNSFVTNIKVESEKGIPEIVDGKLEIFICFDLNIPEGIQFDRIAVFLVGGMDCDMCFEGHFINAVPGHNKISLKCPNVGMVGDFVIENAHFETSKLTLIKSFLQEQQQGKRKQILRMSKSLSGIHMSSSYPSAYWTFGSKVLRLNISIGRDQPLMDASLFLDIPVSSSVCNSNITNAKICMFHEGQITDHDVPYSNNQIILPRLIQKGWLSVEIPIKPFIQGDNHYINADGTNSLDLRLRYLGPDGVESVFHDRLDCVIENPIEMRERIFFNKDQAIVQITVKNVSKIVLLLREGSWQYLEDGADEDAKIEMEFPDFQSQNVILLPEQEVSFCFKLTSSYGLASILPLKARFCLIYYPLNDELASYVESEFKSFFSQSQVSCQEYSYLFYLMKEFINRPLRVSREYFLRESIDFPALMSKGSWQAKIQFGLEGTSFLESVISKWSQFYGHLGVRGRLFVLSQIDVQHLEKVSNLVFEIPSFRSLATVELSLPGARETLEAGKMFNCRFECNLDKAINHEDNVDETTGESFMEFLLEIDVNPNLWFLSGPTKKRFQIPWKTERPSYESNISVIPIRTGLVSLPNLTVTCLSDKSCQTVCNSNGQQVLIHQSNHVARTFYLKQHLLKQQDKPANVLDNNNLKLQITRQLISTLPAIKLEDDGRSLHYSQ